MEIELSAGASIQGQVYGEVGTPQSGQVLEFYDELGYSGSDDQDAGRFGIATTDENGFYRIDHLPTATVYVVRKGAYRSHVVYRHVVFCVDGQSHELNLGGEHRLTGRLFSNGKPLAEVRLQLTGRDPTFGEMKAFSKTDNDGKFTILGAPAGNWSLYRSLSETRGRWAKVRECDVPAESNLELGKIEQGIGTLTVVCKTGGSEFPKNLRMKMVADVPSNYIAREIANLDPRESIDEPFVFQEVPATAVKLVCEYDGCSVEKLIDLSDGQLNTTIDFSLPFGNASINANLSTERGPYLATLNIRSTETGFKQRMSAEKSDNGDMIHSAKNLAAGEYELVPYFSNASTAPLLQFELAAGEQKKITKQIHPVATSKGQASFRITDQHGVYLPIDATILTSNSGPYQQIHQFGNLKISGPIGKIKVTFDHPSFKSIDKEIELRPGQMEPKPIVLIKE